MKDVVNRIRFDAKDFALIRLLESEDLPFFRYAMKVNRESGNVSFFSYEDDKKDTKGAVYLELDSKRQDIALTQDGKTSYLFQRQDNLNQRQNDLEDKLNELTVSVHPVGAILQSFLPPDEFFRQMKDYSTNMAKKNWVLCNGQSVSGSKYGRLVSNTVPDVTNRYLCGSSDPENLKTAEAAVNPRDISVSVRFGDVRAKEEVVFSGKTNADNANLKMFKRDNDKNSGAWGFSEEDNKKCNIFRGSDRTVKFGGGHQNFLMDTGHAHSFFGTANIDARVSGSLHAYVKSPTGATETRPKTQYINTYIRIN